MESCSDPQILMAWNGFHLQRINSLHVMRTRTPSVPRNQLALKMCPNVGLGNHWALPHSSLRYLPIMKLHCHLIERRCKDLEGMCNLLVCNNQRWDPANDVIVGATRQKQQLLVECRLDYGLGSVGIWLALL